NRGVITQHTVVIRSLCGKEIRANQGGCENASDQCHDSNGAGGTRIEATHCNGWRCAHLSVHVPSLAEPDEESATSSSKAFPHRSRQTCVPCQDQKAHRRAPSGRAWMRSLGGIGPHSWIANGMLAHHRPMPVIDSAMPGRFLRPESDFVATGFDVPIMKGGDKSCVRPCAVRRSSGPSVAAFHVAGVGCT
ncbi:MAG: hypothetical protein ACI8UD_001128, partial [Planctomycetota bacterium]